MWTLVVTGSIASFPRKEMAEISQSSETYTQEGGLPVVIMVILFWVSL
jgi:hypothetical protein